MPSVQLLYRGFVRLATIRFGVRRCAGKIGEQTSRRNLERAAWEREHGTVDPEIFTTEILPALMHLPVAAMAKATGLSRNYCATIKASKHVPHARHFETLLRISEP